MSSFEAVINSLSSLSSEGRGKVFERYCKWFLENEPSYAMQLKKVWLWNNWPGNWGRDKGIDLIAEAYDGKIWAIQAKAYDEDYYVTKEDVDRFLSESSRKDISFRLLIATTNNLGVNAQEVMNGQEKLVGLCLLDRLESSAVDWSTTLNNNNTPSAREIKVPYPHQERALHDIITGFERSKYGQLHMACGTGKTLVGMWLAERLQSQITLVLVPSLSLVAQLYLEWANYCSKDFKFDPIFVCSDETVGYKDEDAENPLDKTIELGFPVTTDVAKLLQELAATNRSKVIFATYHSSPIIKNACELDPSLMFDLAIADEAHRCAGKAHSYFATIVDKEAIRTKHKLFMTATPKIFSENVKKKTQELEYPIVSMDDEEQFGPVFHKLPFSEAIKQNLLSDYQVVISIMDNKEYQEYAERGRFVAVNNSETDARTLASQLLVAKVIKQYDLKKVITFHSRKNGAQKFIETFSNATQLLADNNKPAIEFMNTIFCNMPQSERGNILRQFKAETAGCCILGNVRCLSEGVDVPALDGIAFIDPKGSEIDIVQAVGRAIRKPYKESKKIGTILIPIFIDSLADAEVALEQSCFKVVWQVVRALKAHDNILAEELDTIRLELGKQIYRAPAKLGKIIINVPIKIDAEFAEALQLRFIENIVEKCSSWWNYQFNALKEFRVINPDRWPRKQEEFPIGNKLGVWYGSQQHRFKIGQLQKWQIDALTSIGFIGDVFNDRWNRQFHYLKEYRILNLDKWPNSLEEFPSGNKLGQWCDDQRFNHKNNLLSNDRFILLQSLDFPWNPFEEEWEKQFNFLKLFRELNPDRWPEIDEKFPDGNKLGRWCSMQRDKYKNRRLSAIRIQHLDSIGFCWNTFDEAWNKQYQYLVQFRQLNPTRWPKKKEEFPIGNKLANWCVDQRKNFKKNKLSDEKKKKLDNIGFPWILKIKKLKN